MAIAPTPAPHAGTEPGLRFAMLIQANGGVTELSWAEVEKWTPKDGFLWIHLERDAPTTQDWLHHRAGLDPLVALALSADESRPRVEAVEDSLLVVMRGVNRCIQAKDDGLNTELVPLHIWAESTRIITLRDENHSLEALHDLRVIMLAGKGPRAAGALLARIAEKVVDHLGDLIAELEETLSDQEESINSHHHSMATIRSRVIETRRHIAILRRYLLPQRDAMFKLRQDDAFWLDPSAKSHLREVNERLNLHLDDLDEMRQRAVLLHEEMGSKLAEQTNRNTFLLSIVSVIMLPTTFVTGFFGMNTGALPFSTDDPHGTWMATAVIIGVAAITAIAVVLFLRRRSTGE